MTDNDIIKALECCIKGNLCSECPLQAMNCSEKVVEAFAYDLINRQKAEIERLERGQLREAMTFNNATINRCVSEAIKEFADRLKAVSHPYADTQMVFELQIDNLVKEMVGE